MLLKISIFSTFLCALLISGSFAHPRECETVTSLGVCLGNKTVELQISAEDRTCQFTEVSQPKVRDDYTHTPGVGYHKFHPEGKCWNDARKVCMEEGGHLAIINSKQEYSMIQEVFRQRQKSIHHASNDQVAWLGAHNMYSFNDWVTVFGEPLASSGYVPWLKGEPNNYQGREHCLSIYQIELQGFNDNDCDKPFAFVCEIDNVCS